MFVLTGGYSALRKNQNLTIVCQNLTGLRISNVFSPDAFSQSKKIVETNKTSFASYFIDTIEVIKF